MEWEKCGIDVLLLIKDYHLQMEHYEKYKEINEDILTFCSIDRYLWASNYIDYIQHISGTIFSKSENIIVCEMMFSLIERREFNHLYNEVNDFSFNSRSVYILKNNVCEFCNRKFKHKSYLKQHKIYHCKVIKNFRYNNNNFIY